MITTQQPAPDAAESGGHRATRAALVAGLVVYLALLAWIVLWKLEVPWVGEGAQRVVKLVPFAPTAGSGASAPGEVLVNLLLFVPVGLYLGLAAPAWPWWRSAAAVAGVSLVLEAAQYALAVGRSDATDVVVNTAGGLVGFGLLALARRGLGARAARVMTRVCSVVTVLALLASGLFVASPVRFAAPDGGAGLHRSVPGGPPGTGSTGDAPD
ncbi:hypothetical protein GCM10009809_19160 [Isoptericola hypogeus]|uniref:VanZ-like domain-containing protein n=1 Tax=Isoptericola hypogeus TaxID=300179 RepID=A0ABN2JDR0_9MICO